MRILKQSTAYNLTVLMVDSTDHVTGKTGLTLTITASKDGAAFASITPTVTELATGWYKLALTSSHTDTVGDLALHITATGADPTDVAMVVRARVTDDLAYPATSGRSLAVDASGRIDLGAWLGGTPNALQSGRVDSYLGAVASGAIAAASFASGALDAVWSTTTRLLTAGTNIVLAKGTGITGLNDLDAAGVRTAVGLASANLDTQLDALPTAAENADAVWDETISGHLTAGSTGAALNAAGSAGDPWSTSLPGAYGAGTAGKIVGDNLNATVSSRLASASYTAPLDAAGTRSAIGLASANLDTQLDALPTAAENATAVRSELTTELGRIDASVSSRLAAASYTAPLDAAGVRSAVGLASANLDTQIGDLPTASESATAVRSELATELGRIDVAVSSRGTGTALDAAGVRSAVGLATANLDTQLDALPTASENASAVRTNLTTELGRLDAAVSTRLASASYTAPLDAAGTRSAVGLASANLDAQLDALPTAGEVADAVWDEATTGHTTAGTYGGRVLRASNSNVEVQVTGSSHIAADIHELQDGVITAAKFASDAITAAKVAADVGTEIASAVRTNLTTELGRIDATVTSRASQTSVDTLAGYVDTEVAAIKAKTDALPSDPADQSAVEAAITGLLTTQMTESYNADGIAPTVAQALFAIMQRLTEFSISGTTITVKKLDGSTTAFALELDSATAPTSSTRS